MGTIWRELRGSTGFPDPGCVSGKPFHQRAAGMLHTTGEQPASTLGTPEIQFHGRNHTLMSPCRTFLDCKFKSQCEFKL